MSRLKPVAVLLMATALSACARYPVNEPLDALEPAREQAPVDANGSSPHLLMVLTFSGGGTRAAALAYGALETLGQTNLAGYNGGRRLLDEVDVISSVSGGSFTAAYYGVFGERIFGDFEPRFLKRNVQGALSWRVFWPSNWWRLSSGRYNRSELAADYYDSHIFDGAVFADIRANGGPEIHINATDMTRGTPFAFSQEQFDLMCSRLSAFPVSRAVAASAAVPVVFSDIVLRNHAGRCEYETPQWIARTIASNAYPRRSHQAGRILSYLDATDRPYVHLIDGGVADNLGVRSAMHAINLTGTSLGPSPRIDSNEVQRIVFVVVNAETTPDAIVDTNGREPPLAQTVKSATDIQVNRYNFETLLLLRQYLTAWRERARLRLCGGIDCEQVDYYVIEVTFEALATPQRRFFRTLPTSLKLPAATVDELTRAADGILRGSPEFQRLRRDLSQQ
ncbi:MAG: patatin-like phospholipase family protein [Gammaproteobacteria bacterium]